MTAQVAEPVPAPGARTVPPVTQLVIGSLALVIIGGIVMAGNFPQPPSLAIPVALLAGSAILFAVSLLLLSRDPGFAWPVFFGVARWALLGYLVIAGMIEFAFIHNHAGGAPLLVLSLMLLMFALDVPLSIGFTVARFAQPAGS
jgi:hypothetical protein